MQVLLRTCQTSCLFSFDSEGIQYLYEKLEQEMLLFFFFPPLLVPNCDLYEYEAGIINGII